MMTKYFGYDPKELNLDVKGYSGNFEVIVRCPSNTHNDSNASACFNTQTGLLFCFACGYTSNIRELSVTQGIKLEKREIVYSKPDSEELWKEFEKAPLAKNNSYLQSRGLLSNAYVEYFDIRTVKQGVVFLFRNTRNKLVGCQIRQYVKSPKYLTFGERVIFDMTKIMQFDPSEPIYLTEGVFGMIQGHKYGFQTLATIGAMLKKSSLERLQNWSKIYGVFDNDNAGLEASKRLLSVLPQAKIILGATADEMDWTNLHQNYEITSDVLRLKPFVPINHNQRMEFTF